MANIWNDGRFKAFQTDINQLLLVKSRIEHKCWSCHKSILKGSYCLGKNYRWSGSKICLDCANNFLENFIMSIEELKRIGKDTLKDITKNRKKYEQNNVLAKI